MSVTAMVVLIVLIGTIGKVLSGRYAAMGRRAAEGSDAQVGLTHAADEIRLLKERISVLERVITDTHGSIGLDREIERLRDR